MKNKISDLAEHYNDLKLIAFTPNIIMGLAKSKEYKKTKKRGQIQSKNW